MFGSAAAADGKATEPPGDRLDVLDAAVGTRESSRPGVHRVYARTSRMRGNTAVDDIVAHNQVGGPEPEAVRASGRWLARYRVRLVVSDLLAAALASFVAYLIRFTMINVNINTDAELRAYFVASLILPLVWVAFIAVNRAYEGRFIGVGAAEFQRVFRAFLYLTVAVSLASYATKVEVARGFVLIAVPGALLLTLFGRYAARRSLHRKRARGQALTSVIVVGGADAVAHLTAMLRRDVYAGMRVTGACVPVEQVDDARVLAALAAIDVPLLGDIDSIREVVDRTGADTIAVTSSAEVGSEKLRWISWQLEGTPTHVVVAPGLIEVAGSRLHIQPVAGLPLLHVEQPQFDGFRRVLKGAMDRAIAGLALILLLPLLIVIAAFVRLTSHGPALFRQVRVGRDGSTFTMHKFRSMSHGAEDQRIELVDQNDGHGLLFKVRDDPRITRVGRFMRKYSLDELPQLINVVNGTMSLVGPRPPLPEEVAQYGDDVRRRLLVKPGVTGLWQVSGRSDLSWDESVRLDLRYVENWSPALDLTILWKTARTVVRGAGAY